jgi:hypothetical protein
MNRKLHIIVAILALNCFTHAEEIANSIDEFSGVQGQDDWRYGYRNLAEDDGEIDYNSTSDFIEFNENDEWNGTGWALFRDANSGPWTSMGAESAHPNGENSFPNEEHWVVRRWVAEELPEDVETPVAITWHTRETNLNGTGVTGGVHIEGERVDSVALEGGDGDGVTRTVYANLEQAAVVDLVLTPVGFSEDPSDGSDGSGHWMTINTDIPPVPRQPDGTLFIPAGEGAEDSDEDGLPDFWERIFFEDDLTVLFEGGDADEDGLNDEDEFARSTAPNDPDSDDDGLTDNVETHTGTFVSAADTGTNPNLADSDGDGLSDGAEVNGDVTSNPLLTDTDDDTFSDAEEIVAETDPRDPNSNPESFIVANSIEEFSGEQGLDNWFYGYRNFSEDGGGEAYNPNQDFIEFGTDDVEWWNGSAWDWPDGNVPWTVIQAESTHPNGDNNGDVHWTVRRWEAEVASITPLAVTWNVRKQNINGGNGVTGAIHHNGERIDGLAIEGTDGEGETRTVYLNARPSDFVDLILSPRGPNDSDADGSDGSFASMRISTIIPPNPKQPDGTDFIPATGTDSDGDNLPDDWETRFFPGDLAKLSGDADFDEDGLNDRGEFDLDTDPTEGDTDGDGLGDKVETNTSVFASAEDTGSNPKSDDTDGDGRKDGEEVNGEIKTNPVLADTDKDGIGDNVELTETNTDPNNADSDGDGFNDGAEIAEQTDPKDPNSTPASFIADSVKDFSGEQGQDSWFYGYRNLSEDGGEEDSYDPVEDFIEFGTDDVEWWTGSAWDWPDGNVPWTELRPENTHPNGDNNGDVHWTIRRWVAPVDKTTPLAFKWHVRKGNAGGGNGVTGALFINGEQRDSSTIEFNDNVGTFSTYYANTEPGDFVDLILSPLGIDETNNDGSDGSINFLRVDTAIPANPIQPDGSSFVPAFGSGAGFQIESIVLNGNVVTLKWKSSAGKSYAIESSLNVEKWTELDDGHPSGGAETEYVVPDVTDSELYFRVREENQ